ncbi:MAG: putative selenate ABC transporter substrate-binding protein [Chloroflexi bacterium]|nr:putative selenate ABC transporter substrate-binding protein [Chloroflexota bacterium]
MAHAVRRRPGAGRGPWSPAAWLVVLSVLVLAACGQAASGPGGAKTFTISAIPDQDVAALHRQFGAMARYLSEATGLKVEYVPMVDYAALVTAFERGEIHLAWFGGLTAVQAMAVVPDAEAFAQRPRDAEFHSKFIVRAGLLVQRLEDLKGLTFTFGSESSTSGHLMPRYFMLKAGITPERDLKGPPNFAGSHDKTIQLVESGAFQAGAVNEAVWEARLKEGKVDTSKVRVFFTTPAYFDYNWTIRGDVDQTFGSGTKQQVKAAILGMGPSHEEVLKRFATEQFIPTRNENYAAIREVAESIGIIR